MKRRSLSRLLVCALFLFASVAAFPSEGQQAAPTEPPDNIFEAVNRGDSACVDRFLASNGALVNSEHDRGWTPLHWAALRGRLAAVDILLAAGADVNARAEDCMTPLQKAADCGQKDAVERLLAAGANPNLRDYLSRTAAETARSRNHEDIARLIEAYPAKRLRDLRRKAGLPD